MKKRKVIDQIMLTLCLVGGLFWMSGCLDEIDFSSGDTIDQAIAIQGKIVKGSPTYVSVIIRGVFNFEDVPRLLAVKDVSIENNEGAMLELKSNADGVYYLEIPDNHPTFKVEYGNSFRIHVTTFDNRNYSSAFEELFPVPKPEVVTPALTQVEIPTATGGNTIKFDQMTYTVNTPLRVPGSDENVRLLWELESTYKFTDTPQGYSRRSCRPVFKEDDPKTCFLTISPVDNYVALDGTGLNIERLDNFEILNTSIGIVYSEGYYLTVFQQSLSPTAYAYWSQVSQVVERTGDLFQTPAGKVITNFENVDDPNGEIYGYFYATEEAIIRTYVPPSLANNPALACPQPLTEGGQAPSDCCNCATIPSSTTIQPDWWRE